MRASFLLLIPFTVTLTLVAFQKSGETPAASTAAPAASIAKVVQAQGADTASAEFFESRIRPLLANNCYSCHTDSALGGLRLDSRESLVKGGMTGPAIVPGDPDKSLLIKAVRQTDPALMMPLGGKLQDSEVESLAAWIKAGAVWPKTTPVAVAAGKMVISQERKQFWSMLPISMPPMPQVKDPKWAKTDIDKFVLANLEKQGLKPVPLANKHDLIRRATFDLTGLPPTPEEAAAFEKDNSPNAFAKVVDRLLASPHYGERWGRMWLDVARYGEDDYRSLGGGGGRRTYPNAYAYRDWVIQAFNDDMPYSTFVRAQLAGDLMETNNRTKMLAGTGFLGLGPWYYDNGANEVTRADERHDRVDVVSRGFLGLTVACARCHDHKYDPIPQTDYYALAGVFYNTTYEEYPMAPKSVVDSYTRMQDEVDRTQKILQEENTALSSQLANAFAVQSSNYLQGVFDVSQKKEPAAVAESRKLDLEILDRWVKYMAKPTTKYHNKDAWQAMIKKGGNAAAAKNLADKFQEDLLQAMLDKADIDAENEVMKAKALEPGRDGPEGLQPKKRSDKPSNFVSNKDFNPGSDLRLKSLPDEEGNFYTEVFQRELKDVEDPNAMAAAGGRGGNPGVLTFKGYALTRLAGSEAEAKLKALQDDVNAAKKKAGAEYPFIHGVMDSAKPVNIQLALRGNPENLGPEVPRHFLSVFAKGDDPDPLTKGSGRMQLAEDILKQPIAMRVFVNRIWKGHFDTGIVDTPSNFGQVGERPTNPALLEYLTATFVKNGMSVKALQREIMLSTVYQLSTQNNDADYAKDSGNRMYWRFNRRRMDAEELRDSVLSVAGDLDDSMGGPSEELSPADKERTVYGAVSRVKLDTYLSTFDFPIPNISAEKRFTTTTPLQRLFLMNSDFMQIEAENLHKRVAGEVDNSARIKKVYELAYNREPNPEELKLGLDYLHTEPLKEYEENKSKPPEAAAAPRGRGGRGGGGFGGGGGGAKAAAGGADPNTVGVADMANMGNGMMAGVPGAMGGGGRRGGNAPTVDVKYDATAWGRYCKIILSSTEFLFIN
ncbi:MAG TPA: PSD1 and planctomycete cytochrome C domain-containing protein [Bryobacteraceae bacterium]|jgi:cytochrome c553